MATSDIRLAFSAIKRCLIRTGSLEKLYILRILEAIQCVFELTVCGQGVVMRSTYWLRWCWEIQFDDTWVCTRLVRWMIKALR